MLIFKVKKKTTAVEIIECFLFHFVQSLVDFFIFV